MIPYYDDGHGIQIFLGDARAVLPTVSPVDLVLTDPPYGLGRTDPVRHPKGVLQWDSAIPDDELFALVRGAGTTQILWGGNYFPLPPTKGFLIWDKDQPEQFSLAMCELAWTNLDQPAKLFRCPVRSMTGLREHPTQKPVPLMAWCLKQVKNVQTVIDPFMGSGSTLVACKQAGLACIGIEREEAYAEYAARRLSQGVLFGAGEE